MGRHFNDILEQAAKGDDVYLEYIGGPLDGESCIDDHPGIADEWMEVTCFTGHNKVHRYVKYDWCWKYDGVHEGGQEV